MSAARAAAAPSLHGAVAVVLGAGSGPDGVGNGAAIACTYAAAGATVVVGDIDLAAAETTVELIAGAGDKAAAARVDVTSSGSLTALADDVTSGHGRVDVLHNNVGISRLGSPPGLSEDDWRLVIDTNLTGVFLACRAFLPGMRAAGRGARQHPSVAGAVYTATTKRVLRGEGRTEPLHPHPCRPARTGRRARERGAARDDRHPADLPAAVGRAPLGGGHGVRAQPVGAAGTDGFGVGGRLRRAVPRQRFVD